MNNHASVVGGCLLLAGFLVGCALTDELPRKNPPVGFIVTPPSAYTSQKGRYLGERYHRNLERLVQQLVQNPVTRNLQFANNIASVGGIGFFSHSASRSPDERYLEVIMGLPDLLDGRTDFSSKVNRVFSQYGSDLLTILAGDAEIYNEKEIDGFGLNFSWRSTSEGPSGPRVVLERAVVYVSKEDARGFLGGRVNRDQVLAGAVMFAVQGERAATLFRYASRDSRTEGQPGAVREPADKTTEVPKPELKIREIDLYDSPAEKSKDDRPSPPAVPLVKAPKSEPKAEAKGQMPRGKADSPAGSEVKNAKDKEAEAARMEVKPATAPEVPDSRVTKRESPTQKVEEKAEPSKASSASQNETQDVTPQNPIARSQSSPRPPAVTTPRPETTAPLAKPAETVPAAVAKKAPPVSSSASPKSGEAKAEIKDKAETAKKVPVDAAAAIPKEAAERSGKRSEAEIASEPASAGSGAKASKSEVPSRKELDERLSLKAPAIEPQKEIKDRSPQGSTTGLKEPPPSPAVVRTPKREESASNKTGEATSALTGKGVPSVSLPSEPKPQAPLNPPEKTVKDDEGVVKVPSVGVKPSSPAKVETKEPIVDALPRKGTEERMSLSKSPSPLPQKETREKSSPGPSKELKLPPPLPAPLDTPMVQEEPSNKAPPPAPTVVGRAAPSVPLAKEPKPETLEQLALKKAPVSPQRVKPKPEALRDYIVQFSFPERAEAERWAGLLKEEGYATVISVGGDGRPVRLRVGNFPSSTEAKSVLSRLQKKGLTGLVVQLPN